ncbi:uncharacterized protein K460DRAFT_368441 [Cucurbitaria berberidis CBS 394.84]|uniref:Uncharacterized protein n=1 Tax=Cucurbitaria berberidis CBS 394.84 TaxID=1168544 RepID=A0A9P4GDG0_9PLEO|nr:uncharacterized protein K460DRAFT_368441 [Cucurbitaria berberidis CBS 394.84]KAF1843555.1 hypothetical protein K460DRAFT_368441 [Cucurbitaria berberidis CBS 394.84]
MPRPPRTKVALSNARVAKPKPVPRKQPAKAAATQTTKASEAVNSFSEDSDGLVTKSRSTRPRRRMPWEKTPEFINEADLTMTGALPAREEVPEPSIQNRTPAVKSPKRARTTRSSAGSSARRTTPSVVIPAQICSPTADAPEQASQLEEDSGFGDLTFSSLGSESPAHGTRPPSAIKVGATPAHEKSILALTNFKRRARQPSLLRMVQQTTDLEDNDADSLDNTDDFDFDDFLPHAESTPLNLKRNAPEEESRADSGTQVSSSGSRGTKRKLSPVVQVPRSSPPLSSPSRADVESERSPSPSLPEILPSREVAIEQTQDDPELLSETLASPKSSSPVREVSTPPQSPVRTRPHPRRRGRPARTPIRDDDSEVEEIETPAKTKRGPRKKAQQSISTAQLKGLLPRRRNRLRDRDEFDFDSSEEVTQMDSDQDELQMPVRRNRQQPGAGKLTSPKATKKASRGKKAPPAKAAQKASKTYSRRKSSDKENDATGQKDEDAIEVSAIEHSEKLAAIRKKFEEVDAFELEFETVDVTTSSSPFR